MSKQHWRDSYEYHRVLEILSDYWLTEPDEKLVVIDMHFEKDNGEMQDKHITWRNPSYPSEGLKTVTLKEMLVNYEQTLLERRRRYESIHTERTGRSVRSEL